MLVYLDSSDFINFARGAHQTTLNQLKQLKSDGRCHFAFSYLHFLECLSPNCRGSYDERLARARLIEEVTDGNAFPFQSDKSDWQLLGLRKSCWPSDWLDEREIDQFWADQRASYINELRERREINRKVARQLASDRGFKAYLKERGALGRKTTGLSVDFKVDVFFDRNARKTYYEELKSRIMSPTDFVRHHHTSAGAPDPLRSYVLTIESDLTVKLRQIVNFVAKFRQAIACSPDNSQQVLKARITSTIEQSISKYGTDAEIWKHYLVYAIWGNSPPKKESQITDIRHAEYHRFCDLVRVDGPTFEALKGFPAIKPKLVRTIGELPDRISANSLT